MIHRTKSGQSYTVCRGLFGWIIRYEKDGVCDYINVGADDLEVAERVAEALALTHDEGYLIGLGDK